MKKINLCLGLGLGLLSLNSFGFDDPYIPYPDERVYTDYDGKYNTYLIAKNLVSSFVNKSNDIVQLTFYTYMDSKIIVLNPGESFTFLSTVNAPSKDLIQLTYDGLKFCNINMGSTAGSQPFFTKPEEIKGTEPSYQNIDCMFDIKNLSNGKNYLSGRLVLFVGLNNIRHHDMLHNRYSELEYKSLSGACLESQRCTTIHNDDNKETRQTYDIVDNNVYYYGNSPITTKTYHIKTVNENHNDTLEVSFRNYDYNISNVRMYLDEKETTCKYQGSKDPIDISYRLSTNESCDIYLSVDSPKNAGKLNISMKNMTDSKTLLNVTAEKDGSNLKVTNFELHGTTGTTGLSPEKFDENSEVDYR